jgi:predicted AAA+ superfamily ATPase
VISFKFSQDLGKIYENIVFLEFLRKGKEIYYWKNKKECDFLIKEGREKQLIQVCFNLDDPEVKEREVTSLLEAMKKFRKKARLNNYRGF